MPGVYEIPGFSFTVPAGADFRTGAGQHRFVVRNSSGVAVAPTLGGPVLGVRDSKANTGEAVTVRSTGIVLVEASAAIVAGANIASTATGQAVTATVGQTIVGQAVNAAAGAGALVSVQLQTSNVLSL